MPSVFVTYILFAVIFPLAVILVTFNSSLKSKASCVLPSLSVVLVTVILLLPSSSSAPEKSTVFPLATLEPSPLSAETFQPL